MGSDSCLRPVANCTIAPSARSSSDDYVVLLVSATGFRKCISIAYRRKSSLVYGLSVKSSPLPAGFLS